MFVELKATLQKLKPLHVHKGWLFETHLSMTLRGKGMAYVTALGLSNNYLCFVISSMFPHIQYVFVYELHHNPAPLQSTQNVKYTYIWWGVGVPYASP